MRVFRVLAFFILLVGCGRLVIIQGNQHHRLKDLQHSRRLHDNAKPFLGLPRMAAKAPSPDRRRPLVRYQETGPVQLRFYVSPAGSDANPGTISRPFQTPFQARLAARGVNQTSGDIVIYFRGGTYRLSNSLALDGSRDSGRNGFRVVYAAYGDESPVFSGGDTVTGWSRCDIVKNIWCARVSSTMETRQVYVQGTRARRAGADIITPAGTVAFVKTDLGYSNVGWWKGTAELLAWTAPADIEFVYTGANGATPPDGPPHGRWMDSRCGVATIQGGYIDNIIMKPPCFANIKGRHELPTSVENVYELLDEPGEWYLNRATHYLFYKPRWGEDMSTANVVVPMFDSSLDPLQTLASGMGVHNVVFYGITFAYATWTAPNTAEGFVDLGANTRRTSDGLWRQAPASVWFTGSSNVRLERNRFIHLGAQGISFDNASHDNVIIGNELTDISGTGIRIGNVRPADLPVADVRNTVLDNYVHGLPVEYRGGVGIMLGHVASTTVAHNEIAHTPYSGVSLGWGLGQYLGPQDNHIDFNYIHHHMALLGDGGGVYTNGDQGTGAPGQTVRVSTVSGNYIDTQFHNLAPLYHDEGSAWLLTSSNVVTNILDLDDSPPRPYWLFVHGISPGAPPEEHRVPNHDITVSDNYSDVAWRDSSDSLGANITYRSNVTVTTWPSEAAAITRNAGIELAYRDIKAGTAGWNRAQGAEADASSTYSPSHSPSMAIDGNLGTGWSPSGVGSPWYQVNLGQPTELAQIEVVTRQDYDQPETRRDFQVWASNNIDMSLGHEVLGGPTTPLPFHSTYRLGVTSAIKYQYIAVVKNPGNSSLFISELRAYGKDLNLAAGKRAWASSAAARASGAINATDTNETTSWVSARASSLPSLEVDLGGAYQLHQIQIVTSRDLDLPETRRNFEVRASNNADMTAYVLIGGQGTKPLPFGATLTLGVNNGTAYRYVAVVKTSSLESLALSEVRVYGKDSDVAPGKNTGAQSQWSPDFAPSKATDQNVLTGWTPVYGATNVFWQIDLGRPYTLRQISVATRQDLDQVLTRKNLALWASNRSDMSKGHIILGVQTIIALPYQGTWLLDVTDPTAYEFIALVKQDPADGALFIAEFAARGH